MTKLRAAQDPAAKEALTAELRGVLNHMFELEMVTRETQIRGLQERLESLRKEIDQRAAHRAEIVEQRLQEMLKDRPPEERSPEDRPDGPPDDGPGKRDGRGPPRAP
jgi:DNA anti-recombination protein RmuC